MKQIYDLKTEVLKIKYVTCRDILIIFCVSLLWFIPVFIFLGAIYKQQVEQTNTKEYFIEEIQTNDTREVDFYIQQRKNITLSELGKMLFLNDYQVKKNKTFNILIWKEGKFLERRHIKYFTSEIHDPFEHCSVNNCNIVYEDEGIATADAVVFLLKRLNSTQSMPQRNLVEKPNQRWIFLTDESPWNTFANKELNNWKSYSGKFNWSMSYKIESDIPVMYGRTIKISENENVKKEDENLSAFNITDKRRDVLLATLINDCPKDRVRTTYINELQKYLNVDIYGDCGEELKNACNKHFSGDCKLLNNYLFYLAFENSNCDEYLTDAIFWNSYNKGAIPIIMGPTIKNCEILLPPHSFLHVENFKNPEDLANHILNLNKTNSFVELHKWRKSFRVLNEHGYHGTNSFHYCRICEALNYNSDNEKVYNEENLSFYLSPEKNCRNLVI